MTQLQAPSPIFNEGTNPTKGPDFGMKVELYVNDRAEALVLYDRPFSKKLSWLEYDLGSSKLDFVLEDGGFRNFGIPVHPNLAKYMQNAFQVLMVQMDEDSGEQIDGGYFPLIIHRA